MTQTVLLKHALRSRLSNAYYLTVFGYSAPVTDREARKLLLGEWKENKSLELAEIDIIDIRERADFRVVLA